MPPGRPSKRIGESVDGDSSDEHGVKVKSQRTQKATPQNDFSSVVKSKLQSYTRTGQACDRCKVRKIRCDALPEGCSHCTSQNLECYVTDRVTGRTERRGYTQELEREKSAMLAQIRSLEKLLESHGIHAAQFRWPPSVNAPRRSSSRSNLDTSSQDTSQQGSHLTTPLGPSSPFSNSEGTSISAPHDGTSNRPQLITFNSLTLSVLGNDIDLGGFQEAEARDSSLNLPGEPFDYTPEERILLHTMLRLRSPNSVELPTWNEALHYTEWWFTNIYPFLPILHKPSFLSALRALYEAPGSPTQAPAHTISIHMVFATTLRQISSTSLDIAKRTHLRLMSEEHYLYALGRFSELIASRNVQDLRALALILFHATRYSKPRFSLLVADQVLGLSLELGINRARPVQDRRTKLEDEMRKRLWWTILWLTIILRGRAGRPMPLGLHDMDLDYPDALSDETIEQQDVKPVASQACSFLVGLAIMKVARIYLHMFSTIYGIHSKTASYLVSLRALEQQLKNWQDSLPASLRLDEGDITKPPGNSFHALYIHYIGLNLQLYLRHPMTLPFEDSALLDATLQANEDNSKRLLRCLLALHRIRSLEPTWLALGTYTSGAFLHLTSHWHRRNFLSEHEMVELRQDMVSWSMIIEETSQLLENGPSLPVAVNDIVQRVLAWIEHDNQRMGSEARAIQATREMVPKRPDQEPAQMSPFPPIPHNPRLGDLGNRGSVPFPLTSRPDFYGDPSVTNSAMYGQALGYTGAPIHPSNAAPAYAVGHPFGYGEQVRIEPPHRQNHDPAESQRAINSMESYGQGTATGLPQNSHSLMWRTPNENTHDIDAEMAEPEGTGTHGGTSWGDWATTITSSQDHRYGSHGLVAMNPQSRQGARPEGGMRETSGIQMNVSSNVPVTGPEIPWSGMMYPENIDRQQRPE